MSYAVGIDLGTTNCALAFAELGKDAHAPTVLDIPQVTAAGEVSARKLLPSFHYSPGEAELNAGAVALPWNAGAAAAVGVFARAQAASVPARVVASAKSWLSHAGVDRRADILPWGAPAEAPRLSPLEASARYLEHMRNAWDQQNPTAPLAEQRVVLTVPASFDAVARELTVEAARRAGLSESLRLLEEPQAALYAWLADRGPAWRDELEIGDVILVVDIGGGTTDFSLISVREVDGNLALERIAVGDHILLGGDNMDWALAHAVRSQLETLDDWQMRALVHACRAGKEALLSDPELDTFPLAIPSRGSRLVGGVVRADLQRGLVESVLLDGFFPDVASDARPLAPKRSGLTTLGLPYASDAGVTRHLAAFLGRPSLERDAGRTFVHPTKILWNGGVTRSPVVCERMRKLLEAWCVSEGGVAPEVLTGADPELAVSRGASYYAQVREHGGVRIRGGTAQAYYVGIERNELAVPGVAPELDALCIAPFGMEEGSEAALPQPFGLVIGEPVSFRFFGSSTRRTDAVGTVVNPEDLAELSPIETTLPGETGGIAQVKLEAHVTEVGTLELSAVEQGSAQRWKLSFNVRVE